MTEFDYSPAFTQCMVELDIPLARKLFGYVFPHLPQPKDDADTLVILHHARTQSPLIEFKLRAYSHCWLRDHGIPSGLPDKLKPKAEQLYPRVVGVVGISVNTSERMKPAGEIIRGAMQDAVLEAYGDGREEPAFVKERMMEARRSALKKLFG